jgi:hypothetical protein
VFTEDEIKLWHDWVIELGQVEQQQRRASVLASIAAAWDETADEAPSRRRVRAPVSGRRVARWEQIVRSGTAQRRAEPAAAAAAAQAEAEAEAPVLERMDRWIGWSMARVVTHLASHHPQALCDLASFLQQQPAPATGADWHGRICGASNPALPASELLANWAGALGGAGRAAGCLRELVDQNARVPEAMNIVVPGNDGRRVLDTLAAWIKRGCPLPQVTDGKVKPLRLDCTLDEEEQHPLGFSLGFGTVH